MSETEKIKDTESETIIEVKNLSCKIGHKYLLNNVSWNVKAGEHWVVFGMNGSGKTTLLSIIAGFRHHTAGEVSVFGETLNNDNILDVRRKIGWVSASFFDKYYSKEAVMDIVLSGKFGCLGIEEGITLDDRKLAKQLLVELGLEHCCDHAFDMLSKGERQNVLIARALLSKPQILILDEPCTGLDIYNREYLFQTLEQLTEKGNLTIIYVTHYLEEIVPMFDQCLLLKDGVVFAQGAVDSLFTDQTISKFLNYAAVIEKDADNRMMIKMNNVASQLANILFQGEVRCGR